MTFRKAGTARRGTVSSLQRQIGSTVVLFLLPVFFPAGCSVQPYDLKRSGEPMDPAFMQKRLHDVAFPLLIATADWCPFEQEPTYGFLLSDGETSRTAEDD